MTFRNLMNKPELGFYNDRIKWTKLRYVYEARTYHDGKILGSLDKKILAQRPKGFMAVNGTNMINRQGEALIYNRYLPNILEMQNDMDCHRYDTTYTLRKPGKVLTWAFLQHIGKELGYEIVSA